MKNIKRQKLAHLWMTLCGLWLFGACKNDCHEKGNCSPEYYHYELGEAKDYLWAGQGSYWIYKNTKTGELDTQTVLSTKTYWVHTQGRTKYSSNITIDYEVLIRNIFSSYNNWICFDRTNDFNPDAVSFQHNTILNRNIAGEGINIPFSYPFRIGKGGGTGSSFTQCVNLDTGITIGSQKYEHVVIFEIDIDEIWEEKLRCIRPNTRYYWVKNVGLIKREMRRCNYSWELIDYKILP